MKAAKNTMEFTKEVPEATLAVLLKSDEAADAFDGSGLAESAVAMPVGRGLLVSAVDDTAIAKWAGQVKQVKGVEIIRRLTLADLKAELDAEAEYYDSISIEVHIDAKRRVHEMLVAKVKGVESIVVRVILDPGFMSRARVLAVTLTVEDGEWVVAKYTGTQYSTSVDGVTSQDDPAVFLVSDYEEAGEKKFEQCRRDVAEWKVTGGKGESAWVEERVESSDEDFDTVTKKLTEMVGNYSNVVAGIAGGVVNVVDRKFPRGRARQQSAPPRRDAKGAAGGGRIDQSVGARLLAKFQPPADVDVDAETATA